MRRWQWVVLGLVAIAGLGAVTLSWWLGPMRDASFWEPAIAAFEERDAASPPAPGSVLFVGSSSIRMWGTLERDMAPLPVLNRGFGGSHIAHVNHYASRIIVPNEPRAVVLYAGDNDLAAGSQKTPDSVLGDFRRTVEIVHGALPDTTVHFLAIKPSLARWERWPLMHEANEKIAAFAAETQGVEYIDVATPMLGPDGEPREDLFIVDGLHMSAAGYALWTSIVKLRLLGES